MMRRLLMALILSVGSAQVYGSTSERIVDLIDQVKDAQAYWDLMARESKTNLFKRPAHKWFSPSWNKDVTVHRNALRGAEDELLTLLGQLADEQKSISYEGVTRLHRQTSCLLKSHGIPSHLNRRWLSYAALATVMAGAALYLHHFSQSHVLFIIPPGNEQLSSTLHATRPFLGHDYVIDKEGTQYLQIKKGQEHEALRLLELRRIKAVKADPRYGLCWREENNEHKLSKLLREHLVEPVRESWRILRNESPLKTKVLTTDVVFDQNEYEKQMTLLLKDAQTVEQTAPFIASHLNGRKIEDLDFNEKRNAFTALMFSLGELVPAQLRSGIQQLYQTGSPVTTPTHQSNDSPPPPPASHPPTSGIFKGFKDLKNNIEGLTQKADHLATKMEHLKTGQQPPMMQQPPAVGDITSIWIAPQGVNDLAQQANLILKKGDKFLDKADPLADQVGELLNETRAAVTQGKELLASMHNVTQKNSDFATLIVRILIVNGLELKLKGAALGHIIHSYSERMRLNVELSATIPLMLASYLTYVGAKNLYRHLSTRTVIKPLKTDLVQFQLLLNKERYTKDMTMISSRHKGECIYWMGRLERYYDALPSQYRAAYHRFLTELGDKALLPEQRMTIISCLLSQLEQIFSES